MDWKKANDNDPRCQAIGPWRPRACSADESSYLNEGICLTCAKRESCSFNKQSWELGQAAAAVLRSAAVSHLQRGSGAVPRNPTLQSHNGTCVCSYSNVKMDTQTFNCDLFYGFTQSQSPITSNKTHKRPTLSWITQRRDTNMLQTYKMTLLTYRHLRKRPLVQLFTQVKVYAFFLQQDPCLSRELRRWIITNDVCFYNNIWSCINFQVSIGQALIHYCGCNDVIIFFWVKNPHCHYKTSYNFTTYSPFNARLCGKTLFRVILGCF